MDQKKCNIFPPTLDSLASVGQWLRQGNLAALPTETVYGLAGNGYDEKAIARIFSLKNRPQFNPLILHYADLKGMENDVILNEMARLLAQEFWPGPLTFVLPRHPNSRVPLLASAGLSTVAVRIPAPPFIRQLITQEGFPLAAPSANKSGHLSPTTAAHVLQSLGKQSGILVVEGEASCQMGIESTVLDLTQQTPYLLRPGAIPIEKIEAVLKKTILTKELSAGVYTSPGLLSSHYAPRQPVRLNATSVEKNEGLLAFGPHPCAGALLTLNLSEKEDFLEAAANLFSYLHMLESSSCHQIAVMPIPEKHLGKAINDRLRRAAAPRSK